MSTLPNRLLLASAALALLLAVMFSPLDAGRARSIGPTDPEGRAPAAERRTPADSSAAKPAAAAADSRKLYIPILSTDVDFLKTEARFAESAGPQRNVTIVPPQNQFRINAESARILELRKRLIARNGNRIIESQPGYDADVLKAVREEFGMMLQELPQKYPASYARKGNTLLNRMTGDQVSVAALAKLRSPRNALEKLGQMVPYDLLFVKKVAGDYIIIGGNLAFPTNWSLHDQLGAGMTSIHGFVSSDPAKAAKFSEMVNTAIDRTLKHAAVVQRNNFFVQTDPRYPLPNYISTAYPVPPRIDRSTFGDSLFVRMELQTLRGLPESQTVLFGIQPLVYPLKTVLKEPAVAAKLAEGVRLKLLPEVAGQGYLPELESYLQETALGGPEARAQSGAPGRPAIVTTLISRPETEAAHLIRVTKPEGFRADPGGAVRVRLNTTEGIEERIFSLASSPARDYLEFAVSVSDTAFKKKLRSLKPGDTVSVESLGTSLEFRSLRPAVMIANGVGITPFRSYLQFREEQASQGKRQQPAWLFYGNRKVIPFKDELGTMMARGRVMHSLSAPDPASNWTGRTGRIDLDFLKEQLPKLPSDSVFYISGSAGFVADSRKSLEELGILHTRVHSEVFPDSTTLAVTPVVAAEIPDLTTICNCRGVTAGEIRNAVIAGGETSAGTGCGACRCIVGQIRAAMLLRK